uniref:Uncharacterized protein n=1 Tax=Elaeophora elaphi TaxID=1147741 RepID=A0A0R3RHJ3_9BILA
MVVKSVLQEEDAQWKNKCSKIDIIRMLSNVKYEAFVAKESTEQIRTAEIREHKSFHLVHSLYMERSISMEKREKNSLSNCVCDRTEKTIKCLTCGATFRGHIALACKEHPRRINLMDIRIIVNCTLLLDHFIIFENQCGLDCLAVSLLSITEILRKLF